MYIISNAILQGLLDNDQSKIGTADKWPRQCIIHVYVPFGLCSQHLLSLWYLENCQKTPFAASLLCRHPYILQLNSSVEKNLDKPIYNDNYCCIHWEYITLLMKWKSLKHCSYQLSFGVYRLFWHIDSGLGFSLMQFSLFPTLWWVTILPVLHSPNSYMLLPLVRMISDFCRLWLNFIL